MSSSTTLPPHLADRVSDYPNLAESLAEVFDKPPFADDETLSVIEIFYDEVLVLRWENPAVVYEVQLPESYEPKVTEIAVNDELALVFLEDEILFNRLENGEIFAKLPDLITAKV